MSVSGGAPSVATVTGASSVSACKDGEIQLILGPMFSGKTSELMRRVRRYRLYTKCLVISYKVSLHPGWMSSDRLLSSCKAPQTMCESPACLSFVVFY